jgi:4-amino-4-deoxy-L-arabinose transferase-like glycosyltransferase
MPFDTVEGIAWGNQWMLGYNKHPPLAAWLCALFYNIGGVVGVYMLAQLAIILTFFAIWKLASYYFSPLLALVSVLLLEGNLSLTLVSPNFNPTAILAPLWALTFLCYYLALKRQAVKFWLLLGFLVALNILAKYQSIILFIIMFLFMICTIEGRESFKKPGIYMAFLFTSVLILPHFIYSYTQGFPEIYYALKSTASTGAGGFLDHIIMPLHMLINQVGTLALSVVIGLPLFFAKRDPNIVVNRFEFKFLLTMLSGPFVITLLLSVFTGSRMDNNWFVPYFSLIGIAIVLFARPVITKLNITITITLLTTILVLVPLGRYGAIVFNPYLTGKVNSKAYFPGNEIAEKVTTIWEKRYKSKLPYIAGDHYITAYVNTLSKDHPIPFMDLDLEQSAWVKKSDFLRRGGVFIWYAKNRYDVMFGYNKDTIPPRIIEEYPRAIFLGVYNFTIPIMVGSSYSPVRIGIAILPPYK